MREPDNGKLKLYDGTKPSPGAAITTQVLLAEILFNDPCGTVSDGVLTLTFEGETQALATSDVTWCRITDSDNVFVIDADVTDTSGSGAVKIDSIHLYEGGLVRVSTATISEP